jgi:PAS domain S-box-containing protein
LSTRAIRPSALAGQDAEGIARVLVIDEQPTDPHAWVSVAQTIDSRLRVQRVDSPAAIQRAILEGGWTCVLAPQAPTRLSLQAILAMVQVIEPAPGVVLYPDLAGPEARRRWLAAAAQASAASVGTPMPSGQIDLDLGAMTVPSMFGTDVTYSGTDVQAIRALRDSEERFRTLTEIAPVGIFLTDAEQRCVYVNGRWSEITGLPPSEANGLDWRVCLQTQGATLDATSIFAADPTMPVAFENQIARRGAAPSWVIGQMRPYRDSRGDIVGHLGVITDITERKNAEVAILESEQRLRDLSTHMTAVVEAQRADIAREIHDDIGSSLTGMKIDVLRIKQLTAEIPEVQDKIGMFTRLLDSTSAASVRIAKQLRPSILDDGIVPAIDWLCREFARRTDVDVEFVEPDEEPKLAPDQSIALFRVVQEALNNVAKHADAKNVDVVLFARGNELTLEVRDNGVGLPRDRPPQSIERSGGFGITGMRERVLSLGGWMDVTGAPGKGTTVMVGIPLTAKVRSSVFAMP